MSITLAFSCMTCVLFIIAAIVTLTIGGLMGRVLACVYGVGAVVMGAFAVLKVVLMVCGGQ